MKIALIYPRFFPNPGGIETYTRHLAEEMTLLGHEVAVFNSEPLYHNISPNQYEIEGKEYKVYFLHTRKFFGYEIPDKNSFTAIARFNPDIIHISSPHPYSTLTAFSLRKLHRPIIATYHGHANPKSAIKKIGTFFDRVFYRFICRSIIVTSDHYKKEAGKFFPVKKIHVIPLGVEAAYFKDHLTKKDAREQLSLPQKDKTVLFVGGMDKAHYYKGIPVLLKCASMTPDINYLLIGSGDEKPAYMHLAESLKLKNIKFLDTVSTTELHVHYHAADLLVLPSVSNSEGFGMVLTEAMACGTPVITTDKTGSASLIKKSRAGLVVKSNDAKSLKEGIISVLSNQKLRQSLIKNGFNLASKMDWRKTAQETIKIYELSRQKN
jgi:glycosyltransferase involved in cell wall biosynthesis